MIRPYKNSTFNLSLILLKGDILLLCRKGLSGDGTEKDVIRNKHPKKLPLKSCPV